jgi:hypothetical protein
MVFYEEARMNFDLLWNNLAGGMAFCRFAISRIGPIKNLLPSRLILLASLGTPAMKTCIFKLFSQWIRQRIIYYETMNFWKGNLK